MPEKNEPTVDELKARYDATQPDFDLYGQLRERCPVAEVGFGWLLSKYEDVVTVARDDERFASGPAFGFPEGLPEEDSPRREHTPMFIPIMLDPPVFWKYRRLLTPHFTPSKALAREAETRAIATTLIDAFAGAGGADFHRDLAVPLPARLTCRLLGVPEDEWSFFATPVHHLLHERDAGEASSYQGGSEASAAAWDPFLPVIKTMLEIVEQRRKDPQDDLLTFLANAKIDGRPLDDYEIGGIAMLVVIGGVDTTTGAIGTALVHLGRNPDLRKRLIDDPSLIPAAVEEFLRFYSPVQHLGRMTTEDVSLSGVDLPTNSLLSVCWGAANRDPAVFDHPDELDIDRGANPHVAFGVGIHRCLGSNLARMEFRIALEEVLARLPDYELDEEAVELQPNAAIYGYSKIRATFPLPTPR